MRAGFYMDRHGAQLALYRCGANTSQVSWLEPPPVASTHEIVRLPASQRRLVGLPTVRTAPPAR